MNVAKSIENHFNAMAVGYIKMLRQLIKKEEDFKALEDMVLEISDDILKKQLKVLFDAGQIVPCECIKKLKEKLQSDITEMEVFELINKCKLCPECEGTGYRNKIYVDFKAAIEPVKEIEPVEIENKNKVKDKTKNIVKGGKKK